MTRTALVIGAGITGVASALSLLRAGFATTLIDPLATGDPGQTSFGNAGLLASASIIPVQTPGLIWQAPRMLFDPARPLFLKPAYLPRLLPWLIPFLRNGSLKNLDKIVPALRALTHDTVDQHRALAAGSPAAAMIANRDYAFLYRDRAAFADSAFAFGLKKKHGFSWQEHDAARLMADDPEIGADYGFGAVFDSYGSVADPADYVIALAGQFQTEGGILRRLAAREIRPTGQGAEVRTEEGLLAADVVVLAAGIWSRGLAESLGLATPMETERGYHLMLRGVSHMPPFPYMLDDAAIVVTPMRDGLRFAGMVEFGGTKAAPSKAPIRLIRKAISRLYPRLTWQEESDWMGHRPTTADSLPMLGPVPGAPGVICAFGSQHLGLTIAPRLGQAVADLATDAPSQIDLAPYAPERFGRA